jgi:UDP-N-acetylmuramate dehydrogenase
MNAGAFGSEIKDTVIMADVIKNGQYLTYDNKQMKFKYRSSIFKKPNNKSIVVGAYFSLKKGNITEIQKLMQENLEKRKSTNPTQPSAGSIFKKPSPNISAGKIIDEMGLKGLSCGGAAVSEKHAGFIINTGAASSKDVEKLISIIKKKVKEKHKINLQTEIVKMK